MRGLLLLIGVHLMATELSSVDRWFILLDYNRDRHPVTKEEMAPYEMAILDPDHHPPLNENLINIAYVSFGEADDFRSFFPAIKDRDWVKEENPNWPGNHLVDVRATEWHDLLIEEVIPAAIKKGFKGIFMDTLDTVDQISGTKEAMIELVTKVKERYPNLMLISNNGFSILPQIAPLLSAMLVEDIWSMVDFKNDGYQKVPPDARAYKIGIIKPLMKEYSLPLFDIEYTDDPILGEKIRQLSLKEGFNPYIAQRNLDQIYE